MKWARHSGGEWSVEMGGAYLRVLRVGWHRWHWSVTVSKETVDCGSRPTMERAQKMAEARARGLATKEGS